MEVKDDDTHLPGYRYVMHVKEPTDVRIVCADCLKVVPIKWAADDVRIDGLMCHVECHGVERLAFISMRDYITRMPDENGTRRIDVFWRDMMDVRRPDQMQDYETFLTGRIEGLDSIENPTEDNKLDRRTMEQLLTVVRSVTVNQRARGLT